MLDFLTNLLSMPDFSGGTAVAFALTVALWAILGLAVALLFRLVKAVVRLIPGDIDDTILEITYIPILTIIFVWGILDSLQTLNLPENALAIGFRVRNAIIALFIVIILWRAFGQILIYYALTWAIRSESKLDDILVPTVRQVGRIAIFLLGAALVLFYLGVDLTSIWVAIGGISFILAFALNDILSNIFSGMSLIADTPFKYGDLIELEDKKICRVERIGTRITELYNIADHTVIYVPNSTLVTERLLNITKPNTDLRVRIPLGVDYSCDPQKVRDTLENIANSHPNVLSSIPKKIKLMGEHCKEFQNRKLWSKALKYKEEMERLKFEDQLNQEIDLLHLCLEELAIYVDQVEDAGLTNEEKRNISAQIDSAQEIVQRIAHAATRWLMCARYGMMEPLNGQIDAEGSGYAEAEEQIQEYMKHVDVLLLEKSLPLLGTLPIGNERDYNVKRAIRQLVQGGGSTINGTHQFDRGFIDLDERHEFESLAHTWNRKINSLQKKLSRLYQLLRIGNEQRLDDAVYDLKDWIVSDFKETTPEWKYSDVSFVGFGDFTLNFELEFQIDDISREHFGRQTRVETEVREEILLALGSRMPFPQREVVIKNLPNPAVQPIEASRSTSAASNSE